VSDTNCVQAGLRIEMMDDGKPPRLIGAARARCSFEAVPREGERIAVANLTGVTADLAGIGLPLFLKVAYLEHFTSGPGDAEPECWAVVPMTAPSAREGCGALVAALGARGWALDGFRYDHPFAEAVRAWKERTAS
jgi:hypothetical protein